MRTLRRGVGLLADKGGAEAVSGKHSEPALQPKPVTLSRVSFTLLPWMNAAVTLPCVALAHSLFVSVSNARSIEWVPFQTRVLGAVGRRIATGTLAFCSATSLRL